MISGSRAQAFQIISLDRQKTRLIYIATFQNKHLIIITSINLIITSSSSTHLFSDTTLHHTPILMLTSVGEALQKTIIIMMI
jgi:hypothetical protein